MSRIRTLSLGYAVTAMVLGIVAKLMMRPALDPDLFWHLATGRLIARNHAVPRVDPFSWTMPGRRWIAHEWLTELTFWGVHRASGYQGLSILAALIVVIAMTLTWSTMRRLGTSVGVANALTVVGSFAALVTWGVRPQMTSFALSALVIWLTTNAWIDQTPRATRRLWWIPPAMVVWTNLHGGYIFGVALLGAFALGITIDQRIGRRVDPSLLRTAWAATVATVAATMLNPNGLDGFRYPFSYLGDNASTRYVAEWFAPRLSEPRHWPFVALLVLVAVGAVRNARRLPVHAALQVVPLTFLALQSVRNIALFVVVSLPWTGRWTTRLRADSAQRRARTTPPNAGLIHTLLAGFAVFALVTTSLSATSATAQANAQMRSFPVAAASWMHDHPRVRILNQYDWGGYLILNLPDQPVAMDGRPDMYGDSFTDRHVAIWHAESGWESRLDADGYQRVVGHPDQEIMQTLAGNDRWREVYRDDHAVIFDRV